MEIVNLRLCPPPITAADMSVALPFVIPSVADLSRCAVEGSAVLFPTHNPFLKVISTERSSAASSSAVNVAASYRW
jgi:hypothetical protein